MGTLILNTIQNTLNQFPTIKLAIVFGSVANNRETLDSDVDLAILTNDIIGTKQKIQIIESLATSTGRTIDLIDLRTAGQPLLGEIISHGTRILGNNTEYAILITKNLFDQADFLPYRNRILEERRQAWTNK